MLIYKITCKANGKCYIGQTQATLAKRWNDHLYDSKKKGFLLYRAMRKYGVGCFSIEAIETVETTTELNDRERYWVQHYDSHNNGYNSTLGGEDNPMNHESFRLKVSANTKGIKRFLGKKHTQETKDKMSRSALGRRRSVGSKLKQSVTRKERGLGARPGIDHPNSTQVAQVDIKTGQTIQVFPSVSGAEMFFRGRNTSAIHRVISDKYCNATAYGYMWRRCD